MVEENCVFMILGQIGPKYVFLYFFAWSYSSIRTLIKWIFWEEKYFEVIGLKRATNGPTVKVFKIYEKSIR